MKSPDSHPEFTRREFIKTSASLAAAATVAPALLSSAQTPAEKPAPKKMIGIQAGTVSFVDEGIEQVLDIFQEKGAINSVFLATYTYDTGLDGRGRPFPDHGKQVAEPNYHGGHYATPHAEFYHNTILKPERAPDFGDLDIVAALLPPMKKRGMKLFCSIQDSFTYRENSPGMQNLTEVDLQGNRTRTLCLCHPDVRAFWPAVATDLCKSYDIDGIAFFNEHNGPLLNAIGASHAQRIDSARVTCFCEFHQKAARALGISIERAKEGYRKLDQFVKNSLADKRPTDGYFVEFWRLLVEYPEIIAWDKLFDEGKHQVLADVKAAVKAVRKELQVAFHIEHVNSFNPIFRATRSYPDLATKADMLKVVVYNNCGGGRYASFIRNINSTVFRDVPREELMQFNNHLLNYANEAPLNELGRAGLSPDYVFRETQRALNGVNGACKILPGIDIDIPSGRKASPDDAYAATAAGLKAGADGILYSRKYSEMRLANLAAAGKAVREFKT